MINNENLDMIYEDVLNDRELTTKELNNYGFNSKDLKALIDDRTLVRIKRGIYTLGSVDKLFRYGKKLIRQKENDKANFCFSKCFQIDSSHRATCFQLFLINIQKKDYEEAFKYFKILYHSDNDEFINKNNHFYLYLLSMITELPENYRNYAKYLNYEDFKIDDVSDDDLQNKIRFSSYRQKFFSALKQLNDLTNQKGSSNTSLVLIRYLINQAIDVQVENRDKVLNFIKQKEYEKVREFYKELSNKRNLSIIDEYILTLTNDLLDITASKKIPVKKIFSTNNLYEAIKGNNYELALKLVLDNNKRMNVDDESNALFLLLEEIINVCEEIKDKSLEKEVKEEKVINKEDDFVDINKVLSDSGVHSSNDGVKDFYEFLILNLTKISLL